MKSIRRMFGLWVLLVLFGPPLMAAPAREFPPPPPVTPPVEGAPRLVPPPQIPMPGTSAQPVPVPLPPRRPPNVVSAVPPIGARDVDPAIKEILVTFDQDMDTAGYSFTGAHLNYPQVRGEAIWLDQRTCSLPVALAPERFYRVGINERDSRHFKSAGGVVANEAVIYFTTVGASPVDVAALTPPKIVTLRPENGARGVTPGKVQLVAVFDQRMLRDFSLVTVDRMKFPKFVGVGTWTADMRQLTFPANLEAQRNYIIGLNSPDNLIFQNDHGVPLEPINWAFDTIR